MNILIKHPEAKPEGIEILKLDLQSLCSILECWDIELLKYHHLMNKVLLYLLMKREN